MPRAIVLRCPGGPSQLKEETIELKRLEPNELLVRHTAIAVNFHDTYVRSGLYQTLELPGVPGLEAVGLVEAAGSQVVGFQAGDRIAYVDDRYGAYCDVRTLDARKAVHLPDAFGDEIAAASFMKGMTAYVLLHVVTKVRAGDVVVVHAAAGGMGQLLCRWASTLGALVIGTVGSAAKAAIARDCRASHTVLYREEDVTARIMDITRGEGARIVYDSVGASTIDASFDCLSPLGHLISFGQSSGPADSVPLSRLAAKSLTLSRPILFDYIRTESALREIAVATFKAFADKSILPIKPLTLPLGEAAEAHRAIEAGESPGGIVLLP